MLDQVREQGASYLICKHGKPVAELVPHVKPDRLNHWPVDTRDRHFADYGIEVIY